MGMEQDNRVIEVVVVQGHCLLRDALIERLERESWIRVCATASDFEEAWKLIETHKPHELLINVSPKCSRGLPSLKRLKQAIPWLGILAFSCSCEFEDAYVGLALRAGADGFVSSESSMEDLVSAVRSVHERVLWVSTLNEFEKQQLRRSEQLLRTFTLREAEIFSLIGCGYDPRRIAKVMDLGRNQVVNHRERIRRKLELGSLNELVYIASNFMRSAARREPDVPMKDLVKGLFSPEG